MGWGIFIAWFVSFTLDAASSLLKIDWDPDPSIHALMLLVAGSAFVAQAIKKNGGNGSE
jgi:hypothetical protein